MRYFTKPVFLLLFISFFAPIAPRAQTGADPLLDILSSELKRENAALSQEQVAPYFISYNLGDDQNVTMVSSFGALIRSDSSRSRTLLIDLRVGDYKLDNTHQIRTNGGFFGGSGFAGANSRQAPIENDAEALRIALCVKQTEHINPQRNVSKRSRPIARSRSKKKIARQIFQNRPARLPRFTKTLSR